MPGTDKMKDKEMSNTIELEFPKLKFDKNGKADVSQWFGKGCEYTVVGTEDDYGNTAYHCESYNGNFQSGHSTRAESESDAQWHFEQMLQERMSFKTALDAAKRGCKMKRPHWLKRLYHGSLSNEFATVEGDKRSAYEFTCQDYDATDWMFHFPPKKAKPERAEAVILPFEQWKCPKCGNEWDSEPVGLESQTCLIAVGGCGIRLDRPKGK